MGLFGKKSTKEEKKQKAAGEQANAEETLDKDGKKKLQQLFMMEQGIENLKDFCKDLQGEEYKEDREL